MNTLQLIGISALGYKLLTAAATSVQDNFVYEFKKVGLENLDVFGGTARLTLIITNNNPFEATIERFQGRLSFGELSAPILVDRPFSLPTGQRVAASFTITIDNGTLLEQLGTQIDVGGRPSLIISGNLTAGIRNRVLTVPVYATIPIL